MSDKGRGHAAAFITILVWGSTFVVTKILLEDLTATQILVVRFSAAGLLLLPFARGFLRWSGWAVERLWILAGLTGVTAYYLAENAALALTHATDVGLIVTTIPLITALLAHLSQGERWTAGKGWGGVLAGLGVVAVMGNGLSLGLDPLGDLLALGAALSFALYSLVIRRLPRDTPPLVTVARSFLWGTLLALPVLVLDGGWPRWTLLVDPQNGAALAFLVVAASGAAYALWNGAIRVLGPVKTNNYVYLVPVVNTVLGALVLGEPLTLLTGAGSLLIVTGVIWASR